jgi:DNA polymerase-3 subunit beta
MKLIIERDAFLKSLAKMQGIVDKRNAMPILSNALLRASEAHLEIIATDLEVTVMDKCPVDLHTEGTLTLNARKLYDIVRELPDGPISLTASAEHQVEVKSGKVRFELMGLSAEDYPKIPDAQDFKYVEMKSKTLLNMIEKTIYATAGEEARFSLNGIYTEKTEEGNGLRMVATDGHRLAMVERELESKLKMDKGIILPRKGMAEAVKVLGDYDGKVAFAVKDKMAAISANDTVILMRLVDGKFPDYRKVIVEGSEKKAVIVCDELVRNLRRVSIMVDEKARAVRFGFEKGVLKLESKNPNFGSSSTEMEIEYEADNMNIGFNDRYFIDIISAAKCEKITIELRDDQSPALVKVSDDPKYTCVVMPMRL